MANANHYERSTALTNSSRTKAAVSVHAQAAAKTPSHPDLMLQAWEALMQANRATQKLELFSLYLSPAEREAAQQAAAHMSTALNDCWSAFRVEDQ